jgi:hypothetical protein
MPWWLPLALALPYYMLWTLIHEGSHALIVLLKRGEIVSFKPWPHRDKGEFFIGRVVYRGIERADIFSVAPYLVDSIIGTAAFLAGLLIPPLEGLFLLFLLGPVVDILNAVRLLIMERKDCDLYKVESPVLVCLIALSGLVLSNLATALVLT